MLYWGEFEVHQWSKLFFFCPSPTPAFFPSLEWCHSASDHRRSEGVSEASDGSLSLQINRTCPQHSLSLSFSPYSHIHSAISSFSPISSQMLWNWSGFTLHLSYLFRRLPNTRFLKRCCDHKLSTLWWKSFSPQKLQGQSALASSVWNEPSGKKFQGFGGCRSKISRDSESQIFDSAFPQSENVSSSFLSFFRLPLGPTLINLRLSSVWHVFISLFQADTLALFTVLMWDFYLEVRQSTQEAEMSEIVPLQNCKTVTSGWQRRFLIVMTAEQELGPESHANKSHSNRVQKGYTVSTDYKRQTGRNLQKKKNLSCRIFSYLFWPKIPALIVFFFFKEVSVKKFWYFQNLRLLF